MLPALALAGIALATDVVVYPGGDPKSALAYFPRAKRSLASSAKIQRGQRRALSLTA